MHQSDYTELERKKILVYGGAVSLGLMIALAADVQSNGYTIASEELPEDNLYALRSYHEEWPEAVISKRKKEPYYNKFNKNRKKGRNRW